MLGHYSHVKLLEIRDQLFFLAALAYPQTKEEEEVLLEIARDALGGSFERCAEQIDLLLNHAVMRPPVQRVW